MSGSPGASAARRAIVALLALVLPACTDVGPAQPDGVMSLVAHAYLSDALRIMELRSVRRYEIDWPAFREETLTAASGAETVEDTYPVIEDALERLRDGHSFFRPPVESAPPAEGEDPTASLFGDVGYVDVPAFSGGGSDADDLARVYHDVIEGVDTLGASCRWVVDLRGNTGGNMWPMLAGVGPILGEGTVGFFVDPDSVVQAWAYDDGMAKIDEQVVASASPGYRLQEALPHVAVLTDSLTASSGEAVAVAFRGRDDARSFGGATWGVSTANAPFPLSDGAVIFLTVTTMADRSGEIYGGRLPPDEPLAGEKTGDRSTDAVLDAALGWLESRACA